MHSLGCSRVSDSYTFSLAAAAFHSLPDVGRFFLAASHSKRHEQAIDGTVPSCCGRLGSESSFTCFK